MLRIGNFSGYWGDDPDALLRQLVGGPVDYLTGDYLAELTMAILERHRRSDARAGFATSFIEHLRGALPELVARGTRLVVNAGGVNLEACKAAVLALVGDAVPIATVGGSDVDVAALEARGVSLANADTGEPFDPIRARLLSAHAYLGARPIAEALALGVQIVITGRVTDAALALGPMIHRFGWSETDWHPLAAGTIAGHILECGAQATGGVFTDFEAIEPGRLGYPIVEMESDGSFVVTKHEGTGGEVSVATVAEQLLYEIGDPRAYRTPDVTADFTSITVEQAGRDRVRVAGARGSPPPPELKLSIVYGAGYRAVANVLASGPRVRAKADRLAALLAPEFPGGFADARLDVIGTGDGVMRFAVRDLDRAKVDRFVRRLLGLFVQAPPGVAMLGGRPHTEEAFGFWPALIPRDAVVAEVALVDGERRRVPLGSIVDGDPATRRTVPLGPSAVAAVLAATPDAPRAHPGPTRRIRLRELAHARSGDKGDRANIGVRARSEAAFHMLRGALTAERVRDHVRDRVLGPVVRYELPNLRAFNFVLDRALGGGGSISLCPDPLGKTMSDALLELELDLDES